MMLWRIISIITFVTFIVLVVFLYFRKYRKNYYNHSFLDDECIDEVRDGGSRNYIYLVSGETKKYIKRYALRKSHYDKSVIVNYAEAYEKIGFYVVCYNKKNIPIQVIYVNESDTSQSSRIIAVSRKTNKVNVVIRAVEGRIINKNVIKGIPLPKIRLYSFLSSICFVCFLISLRQVALEIAGELNVRVYLDSAWNYIGIALIFIVGILMYFISAKSLRNRNCKNIDGGAIAYEFI